MRRPRDLHRLAAAGLGLGVGEVGAAPPGEQPTDVGPVVLAQPGLRRPGQLEEADVGRGAQLGPVGQQRLPQPHRVRHADDGQAAHDTGVQGRDGPGQHPAPVVTDDHRVARSQRPHHPRHVGGQRVRVVAARRLVGRAVAAQVGGDDPEARVAEREELVPPGPPELREAVQQDHERTVGRAVLGEVEASPVGRHLAVRPRAVDEHDGILGGHPASLARPRIGPNRAAICWTRPSPPRWRWGSWPRRCRP